MRKTPLHEVHTALGAKMVDFSGWEMPLQYAGIVKEHKAVRQAAGLFDVSHMGQVRIEGPTALQTVSNLMTNNPAHIADGQAMYTLMCKADGGIIDDLIVYRESETAFSAVLNAANVDKDLAWIRHYALEDTTIVDTSAETALIACQGPEAVGIVTSIMAKPAEIKPFRFATATVNGYEVMAARTGYTGEDGFELAVDAGKAQDLWHALMQAGQDKGLVPAGLGARDTLRLEAKLCLYGNDIDEETTPLEAALGWAVKMDHDFIGKESLEEQKEQGLTRKLVGFRIQGRGIARPGYDVSADGSKIGRVTSGTKGISVEGSIGLAIVDMRHAAIGSSVEIDCRGRMVPAEVVKGKFYQR